MLNDNEKAAVPVPPVGVDGEQPQINNNKNSITDSAEECKGENALEESLEKLRQMQRVLDPSYLYTLTLRELYENVYRSGPPLVEDLLYPGTYLLAGAPKVGKSFLVAQVAYHISTGTPLWNYPVKQSPVLYLALEDDYGRLQKRLYRMYGTESTENLYFAVDAKSLSIGLEDQLENFLQEHKETRLIIIDTLQKIRDAGGDAMSYANDYMQIGRLKQFAQKYQLCLLLVHHTRKQAAADKFDMISGTNGLLGAADGAFVLWKGSRTDSKAILEVVGREQQEQRMHLKKDPERRNWRKRNFLHGGNQQIRYWRQSLFL